MTLIYTLPIQRHFRPGILAFCLLIYIQFDKAILLVLDISSEFLLIVTKPVKNIPGSVELWELILFLAQIFCTCVSMKCAM